MKKVLIYAGTTEGRELAQELARERIYCDISVATEYGRQIMVKDFAVYLYFTGQNDSRTDAPKV